VGNPYCETLGIAVPRLAELVGHPEANAYSLFLVALLEAGGPMTLQDAAARFEEAGAGPSEVVLRSLKRSRPGRSPVYRHEDLYHLDPFDFELEMWAFRLGLRPSRAAQLPDDATPEQVADWNRRFREEHERDATRYAAMRRAVIHAFPADAPRALVLLDVDDGRVERFAGDHLAEAPACLAAYDVLAAVNIRPTLLALGMDVARLRLHELRPPQQTIRVGSRGRVVDVTMERLFRGSIALRGRWGLEAPLRKLLDGGRIEQLLQRLEAEVMDLGALYHYSRVHGALRLRWRSVDVMLHVPWVEPFDEWRIRSWMKRAHEAEQPLDVVAGAAPDPDHPWKTGTWCTVYGPEGYLPVLVTADRRIIPLEDVQRLRMVRPGAWHAPLPAEVAGPSTGVGVSPDSYRSYDRILRLRVTLELERDPVWRLIEVPESATFWDLHVAIQDAMGWLDYHLHVFRVQASRHHPPIQIGIPVDELGDDWEILPGWHIPVLDVLNAEGPDCEYEYDFGDSWLHRLHLEAVAPADPALEYPRCVAGDRACPPEDVGGTHGYEEFLAAIADPTHEEHESYLTWAGGSFDPNAFRVEDVTFDDSAWRWAHAFAVD
jgi:hypothetical protein